MCEILKDFGGVAKMLIWLVPKIEIKRGNREWLVMAILLLLLYLSIKDRNYYHWTILQKKFTSGDPPRIPK